MGKDLWLGGVEFSFPDTGLAADLPIDFDFIPFAEHFQPQAGWILSPPRKSINPAFLPPFFVLVTNEEGGKRTHTNDEFSGIHIGKFGVGGRTSNLITKIDI